MARAPENFSGMSQITRNSNRLNYANFFGEFQRYFFQFFPQKGEVLIFDLLIHFCYHALTFNHLCSPFPWVPNPGFPLEKEFQCWGLAWRRKKARGDPPATFLP
jgi:hypothetical protein